MARTVSMDAIAGNIKPITDEKRLKQAEANLREQRANNQVGKIDEAGKLTGEMVLGKFEEMIKITIATLKNQNPDDPLKPSEIAATFQGFSQTLGLVEIKKMMEGLTKTASINQLQQTASQMGKLVEVKASHFNHMSGKPDILCALMPEGTVQASFEIRDEVGRPIYVETGETRPGKREFTWKGMTKDNEEAKPGRYSFYIQAIDKDGQVLKDDDGKDIEVPLSIKGQIEKSTLKNNQAYIGVNGAEYPVDTIMTLQEVFDFSPPQDNADGATPPADEGTDTAQEPAAVAQAAAPSKAERRAAMKLYREQTGGFGNQIEELYAPYPRMNPGLQQEIMQKAAQLAANR